MKHTQIVFIYNAVFIILGLFVFVFAAHAATCTVDQVSQACGANICGSSQQPSGEPSPSPSGGVTGEPTGEPTAGPTINPPETPGCDTKQYGDANCDGAYDLTNDFSEWRAEFEAVNTGRSHSNDADNDENEWDTDFNGDRTISLADFNIWRNTFQQVQKGTPEPIE